MCMWNLYLLMSVCVCAWCCCGILPTPFPIYPGHKGRAVLHEVTSCQVVWIPRSFQELRSRGQRRQGLRCNFSPVTVPVGKKISFGISKSWSSWRDLREIYAALRSSPFRNYPSPDHLLMLAMVAVVGSSLHQHLHTQRKFHGSLGETQQVRQVRQVRQPQVVEPHPPNHWLH